MKDHDTLDLQTPDSFRLYLDEVGRHPLLTKDDEIELSQAFEPGPVGMTGPGSRQRRSTASGRVAR